MFQKIQAHVQWRSDLLMAGRYDDLARTYVVPHVIYIEGKVFTQTSTAAILSFLAQLHAQSIARKVTRCTARLTALEMARNDRFRAWVNLNDELAGIPSDQSTEAVYYFRQTPMGLQTEMVDFTRLAMPKRPLYQHLALCRA